MTGTGQDHHDVPTPPLQRNEESRCVTPPPSSSFPLQILLRSLQWNALCSCMAVLMAKSRPWRPLSKDSYLHTKDDKLCREFFCTHGVE